MNKKIVVLIIFLGLVSCQNVKSENMVENLLITPSATSVQTDIPNNYHIKIEQGITPASHMTQASTGYTDLIRTFPKIDGLHGIITITADHNKILINFDKNGIYKLNCNNPDYKSNDNCLLNSYRIQLSGHPIEIERLGSNYLAVFENFENHKFNIYRFDKNLESLTEIYSGDMINDLWLTSPKVSNDTMNIAGVKNKGSWDNPLIIINLEKTKEHEVNLEPPYFMTYNLAWSPSDKKILVGASNVQTEIGLCTNLLLVYNIEDLSRIAQFSSDKVNCFDDFDLVARTNTTSLWSPDEKNIAVIGDHKELCLANIERQIISCYTPVNQLNEEIWSVEWSPGSNFVAYITTGEKSQINIIDSQNYEIIFNENFDDDLEGIWYELNWQD